MMVLLKLVVVLLLVPLCTPFTFSRTFSRTLSRPTRTDLSLRATNVGFIGCGTIASAIAQGIATQSQVSIDSIVVSKRSEQKSKLLVETLNIQRPNLPVSIVDDNQQILDQTEIVFVCVLPEQTSQVLQDLSFDNEKHTLISLVSTAKLEDLQKDSKLDSSNVSKMICLPSIRRHQGVCLHCCPTPNPFLESLFESTGGVVTLKTEQELEASMMTTCVMGPIYGMMRQGRDWLTERTDLTQEEASYLVIKQITGAVLDAERDCENNANRLDELIKEQTPGGLNEQALGNLDTLGGLAIQTQVMDAILARIRGESDGSVLS